ncbi:multi-sensor signal transduction histidine kinase [Thalassoporum mexicanum PCC 7367]|uniref:PAS domain S-box protein n=1 Tax=Thalassoporum mexicanum TaxID=3457544 RepID=UPI00029FF461|nr:PAS domain S-box protein [Pseudanabaena sp. PCC 7367]AFY69998.1 multi-sensor signal transduction histidine kinase [Pseudanabaena sp. PCC 7367]
MEPKARILIVEDDGVTALNIHTRLCQSGYAVLAIVESAEQAITYVDLTYANERIDLVLMDIHLKGEQDGIAAADQIQGRFNIPVVYLTANTDQTTIDRAKLTSPYGYVIKPFQTADLLSVIEIALHKYEVDQQLKEREQWLSATLKSIGDAVITTDAAGQITFMNPLAEELTACLRANCNGCNLSHILNLTDSQTSLPCEDITTKTLNQGSSFTSKHHVWLHNQADQQIPIEYQISPIRSDRQVITGAVLVFRDVSDRLETEQALQRSEANFSRLVEADVIGMIIGNIKGEVPYVNDYFLNMLGYSRTDFEAEAINWRKITPPEDLKIDEEVINDLNQGKPRSYEKAYIHKNGQHVPVLIGTTKLEGYEIDTAIGFVLDLRERKQIEQELHDLNQKLEQKVAARTANLAEVNNKLLVEIAERAKAEQLLTEYLHKLQRFQETTFELSCAETLEQIYDVAIAQISSFIGTARAGLLLTNDEDLSQVYFAAACGISEHFCKNIAQTLSESGYISSDKEAIYADVKQAIALQPILPLLEQEQIGAITSFPLKYQGQLMGRLVLYYDQPNGFANQDLNLANALSTSVAVAISRKRTEIALRDRERQYRSLVDNIPGLIYRVLPDRQSSVQFVSQQVEALIGYSSAELIQNPNLSFVDLIHPEDLPAVIAQVNRAIAAKQPFELQYRIIAANGEVKWVNEKGQGIADAKNGEIAYLDGVIFDISDRKALEAKHQLYNERLHNLYQSVFDLGQAPGLEELYDVALSGVKQTLKCDRVAILLFDAHQQWQVVRTDGISPPHGQLIETCLNSEAAIVCANDHESGANIYADIRRSPLPQPLLELSLVEGVASIGIAWIKNKDKLIGQIAFHYNQSHDFSDQEIQLVDTLAAYIGIAITRKQSEQLLAISENRYRSLVGNVRGAIYRCNMHNDWQTEFISDAVQDICGYPATYFTDPTNGKSFLSLIHPADRKSIRQTIRQAIDHQQPYELEYRIIDVNGQERWVLDCGIGVYEDGDCVYEDGVIFDITNRKNTEAELHRSKATQQAIIEAIPDLLARVRRDGTYLNIITNGEVTLLNPAQMKSGMNIVDIYPPEIAQQRLNYVQAAIDNQTMQAYEYQIEVDGQEFYEEARIVPCGKDEALIMVRDITDRKLTEAELRQSKATQQAIIEAIPDLLVRMDRDGKYLNIMSGGKVKLVNEAQIKPGSNMRDITPLDFAEERIRRVQKALDSQEIEIYEYQVEIQGESRDEEARIVTCGTNEVLVMVRDITDRKRAERSLKDSEEKYRVLFNSIGDPVFVHGHNKQVPTEFIEVNDLACNSLGYSRDELYRMTVRDILPPGFRYDPEAIEAFLRDREAIFKVEHVHADGHRFPVEVSARAFYLDNELMVVGIARDVSEHKQIEAEWRRAYEKQKELADLRSQFIEMVSHEFRTPMSSMLLSIELLEHRSDDWDNEKKHQRFARIRQGIKRIDNLIEDVLVMGKLNAGQMRFQPTPIDFLDLCLELVEEARIITNKHFISLSIDGVVCQEMEPDGNEMASDDENIAAIAPDLAPLAPTKPTSIVGLQHTYMDDRLIQHILSNLLSNALKYSPQGGDIELSMVFQPDFVPLPTKPAQESQNDDRNFTDFNSFAVSHNGSSDRHNHDDTVELVAKPDWIGHTKFDLEQPLNAIGTIVITVRDPGIGIEPEDQAHLFKEFHRGQNVSNIPGTGLGLAIVKRAVNLHRGHISVDSKVGLGTTFVVELPVYQLEYALED